MFRSTPKELVFAQALFGFELASADPRVVAINLVGEEDEHTSMTDYADHMRIVGYLRTLYPKVRVSLHAGELAPGLVPPERFMARIDAAELLERPEEMVVPRLPFRRHEAAHGEGVDQAVVKAGSL